MALKKHLIIILLLVLASSPLIAGNTGKIAGRVIDKSTGEPLAGANILIEDSQLGASTDEDGYFFFINLPPGKYTLVAMYVGYHDLTIKNLQVNVDLTSKIDFEMESATIETPTITVVAKKEMIRQDITSTRKITDREELLSTPGMETTDDIL